MKTTRIKALVLSIEDGYVNIKVMNGSYESYERDLFPPDIKEDEQIDIIFDDKIPPQIKAIARQIGNCEVLYQSKSKKINALNKRIMSLGRALTSSPQNKAIKKKQTELKEQVIIYAEDLQDITGQVETYKRLMFALA